MNSGYFIKRLFFACITIYVVMLLVFFSKLLSTSDEVEKLLSLQGMEENINPTAYQKEYEKLYKSLKLDQALFYFSILPSNYPDNINAIINPKVKQRFKSALKKGMHYNEIVRLENEGILDKVIANQNFKRTSIWIPKIVFNGFDNQYHQWMTSIIGGKLGTSTKDGMPIIKKITGSFKWTFGIVLVNMLIAIPLALLLGVFLYRKRNEKIAKLFDTFSVMLLSIPVFWLATLCVVYLSSDYYGIGIFKNIGLWHPSKTGFFQNIDKLILPITILVLLDVAYLTKLFKASATEEHKKPYVQSLIAKGLSEKQSINRHLLKNALIPIITLIVGALPQAFAGSLLLEVIFNIPGMGRLMYDSIYAADYNTSTAIILIVVLMTIISYWMGDLLYRKVNPKIYYH